MAKEIASVKDRFFAWLIDGLIVTVFQLPGILIFSTLFNTPVYKLFSRKENIDFSWPLMVFILIAITIYFAYFVYFHGKYGQTVGKKEMGIKVVLLNDKTIGYKTAFFRLLWPVVISLIPFCSSLFDLADGLTLIYRKEDHRSIHDLMVKTKVIKV